MSSMTSGDVSRIVGEARDRGVHPDLNRANLADANLRGANLYGADLSGANLADANLRDADLSYANLRGANLADANLADANLRGANLYGANLYGANLSYANLSGANLYSEYPLGTRWDGLVIDGLHTQRILLTPTPTGWWLAIGCWFGTPDELRTLIAQDDGWPEARGDEIARRRPLLEAALLVVDAHITAHPDVINDLKERWEA